MDHLSSLSQSTKGEALTMLMVSVVGSGRALLVVALDGS